MEKSARRLQALRQKLTQIEMVEKKAEQDAVERSKKEAEALVLKIRDELESSAAFERAALNDYYVWKSRLLKKLKLEIGMCEKCKRNDLGYTIDHIIPQAILKDMGIEPHKDRNEGNLRLLCQLCNTRKGERLDFTDKRTKPLLLEYLKAFPGTPDLAEVQNPNTLEEPKWYRTKVARTLKRIFR